MHPALETQVKTNKNKAKEFGEVFTPLWLVDEMLDQTEVNPETSTLDLCAGYGQFSIRLLRKLSKENKKFDCDAFLKEKHSFCELQLSSCYKLLNTFSTHINLFIGDATKLPRLPTFAKGIWIFLEEMDGWVPATKAVRKMMFQDLRKSKSPTSEEEFCIKLQCLIDTLNNAYKMVYNEYFTKDSQANRLAYINRLNSHMNKNHAENDQHKETPQSVIKDMLSGVEGLETKQILVLFNLEILETLIHNKKVPAEHITFACEKRDEMRASFAKKHYEVDVLLFEDRTPEEIVKVFDKKKFDLAISNPPYTRGLDLKILLALIGSKIAKEYVIVHPSTWLLDRKNGLPIYGNLKNAVSNHICSLKFFNGNNIFGIEALVPIVISHLDFTNSIEDIDVQFFEQKFTANSVNDITKFGKDWFILVKPLFKVIEKYVVSHGSVWDHNVRQLTDGKHYCQLSAMMGTAVDSHDMKYRGKMVKDDFYSLTRTTSSNKGADPRKLNKPGNPVPTFEFSSDIEVDNFLCYLNTDFARFCLSLLKNNLNVSVGEMELIPWLDFTQAWDDEKLFAHFDIDQATQNYIRSFLPDYYGIRKAKTSNAA